MKKLIFVLICLSSDAFATNWTKIGTVHLNGGAAYDLRNVPIPVNRLVSGNYFLILMPRSCGNIAFRDIVLYDSAGPVYGDLYRNVQNENQTEWSYILNKTTALTGIGMYVDAPYDCFIDFYIIVRTPDPIPTPTPTPTPTAPGNPLQRHCRRVAFDLSYDYEGHFDQVAAVAGDPCFVFIRFTLLPDYRAYLDDRRAKSKSPDFEIVQPENVKVEIEQRVGNN